MGAQTGILSIGNMHFRCSLGRSGRKCLKREGDGATPVGAWDFRRIFYRGDRMKPPRASAGPRALRPFDGWCETVGDRNYNRLVRMPYAASHETMRRADGLYDICIVLDWNIRPRLRGRGSAIFFHLARDGFTPTQGCVAVTRQVMERLLPYLSTRTILSVK